MNKYVNKYIIPPLKILHYFQANTIKIRVIWLRRTDRTTWMLHNVFITSKEF